MTVSSIEVTAGSGTHLHTNSRTISSVVRHDQYIQHGEGAYPSYSVYAREISVATTGDHILQVMGDGTNYTRLKRLRISITADIPAAATVLDLILYRLSTAGTGGAAVTPASYDGSDTYAGGAMTLPTAKGTETFGMYAFRLAVPSAHPLVSSMVWEARQDMKPIVFGTGTGSGIALKIITGVASCTMDVLAELTVTSYI